MSRKVKIVRGAWGASHWMAATTCREEACDHCHFRFRCLTTRDPLEVTSDELEELSLRFISGNDLLRIIREHRDKEKYLYYKALFWNITKKRNMNVGYTPLLFKPL